MADPNRLRPWRVASLATSLGLTLAAAAVAVTGAVGGTAAAQAVPTEGDSGPGVAVVGAVSGVRAGVDAALRTALASPADRPVGATDRTTDQLAAHPPSRSGNGRRVVFDESAQQVWLVGNRSSVVTTYLVSGSVHDNLDPGTYEVYSRSLHAVGFDYRSTMDFMVRFAQGDNAAIGFHDIPVDDRREPVQRLAELGTPTSSGCIRQRPRHARQMWHFAQLGTTVVVVA